MLETAPPTRDDAPLVTALLRRMLEDMEAMGSDRLRRDDAAWAELEALVRGKLEGSPDRLWLVARDDGAPVGLLEAEVAALQVFYGGRRLLHIASVYVDPARRRRGIARRLLDEAFAWGRARGCEEVKLNVLVTNPARELYERLGFAERRVEMRRPLM